MKRHEQFRVADPQSEVGLTGVGPLDHDQERLVEDEVRIDAAAAAITDSDLSIGSSSRSSLKTGLLRGHPYNGPPNDFSVVAEHVEVNYGNEQVASSLH